MSGQTGGDRRTSTVLGDADLFFFFLRGGTFEEQAERIVRAADSGELTLRTSSEVYDDAISAIRADGTSLSVANSFVADMKSIAHTALPMSAEIAEEALSLYMAQGGRRKLSYFDSFHVATAKRYDLALLTSDRFILANSGSLRIRSMNLAHWK